MKKIVLVAALLACVYAACALSKNGGHAYGDSIAPDQGSVQSALNKLIDADTNTLQAAPNEIASDRLMDKFGKDVCDRINNLRELSGWTGTINYIHPNGDFGINSEPFNIFGTVPKGSKLFNDLADIKENAPVRITGVIDAGPVPTDFAADATQNEWDDVACQGWTDLISITLAVKLESIQNIKP